MNNLQYVERAISKDETRSNMCRVYRDKKHLVATDGHRIHFANGLPELEKGHYLDGYDGAFPSWDQVMPTGPVIAKVDLAISKDEVRKLKAVINFAFKVLNDRNITCKFRFEKNQLLVTAQDKQCNLCTIALDFRYESNIPLDKPIELALNAQYFLDATEPQKDMFNVVVSLELRGATEGILITVPMGKAIVMPMRMI
jgi:hypothetical protein